MLAWLDWVELAEADPVGIWADTRVLVVTVVVEIVPGTHFPPERMNPSLLEQVLQATPPSLYAEEKVPAGQAGTQSFPLATNPLLQLAQSLLGSTPTDT